MLPRCSVRLESRLVLLWIGLIHCGAVKWEREKTLLLLRLLHSWCNSSWTPLQCPFYCSFVISGKKGQVLGSRQTRNVTRNTRNSQQQMQQESNLDLRSRIPTFQSFATYASVSWAGAFRCRAGASRGAEHFFFTLNNSAGHLFWLFFCNFLVFHQKRQKSSLPGTWAQNSQHWYAFSSSGPAWPHTERRSTFKEEIYVQSPALLVDSEPQLWTAGVSST